MSAKLLAALATVLVMETIEGAHHAARIALEASEPPATGLDVERLREALDHTTAMNEDDAAGWAPIIAAEYARLTGAAE